MKINKDDLVFIFVLAGLASIPITWALTLYHVDIQQKELEIKHIHEAIQKLNDY